jgi:hypothetical protein
MKRIQQFFLLAFPVIIFAQESPPLNNLNVLSWLAGTWESKTDKNITTEKWIELSPKSLEGFASVSKIGAESPDFSESLRMLSMKGEIFYLAKVDHNEMPIPFKLVSDSENSFVFENRHHDFPQRITYIKNGDDSMTVRVEGLTEPDIRYFDVHYSRKD